MIFLHRSLTVLYVSGYSSFVSASSNYTFQYPDEVGYEADLPLPQHEQIIWGTNSYFAFEQDNAPVVFMSDAYNEDVIVDLLTQVYDLNIKLGYFPRDAFMYPEDTSTQPTGNKPRHEFTPTQRADFEQINLDPRLVSLLERLPYQREENWQSYTFWRYGTLAARPFGTDLHYRKVLYCEDEWPLGTAEIALLVTYQRDGHNLILNVEDNTMRDWDIWDGFRDARKAPDFLREWVADILTLRVISWQEQPGSDDYRLIDAPRDFDPSAPITDEEIEPLPPGTDWVECELRKYKFLKRTLEQEYGWPNNFQQERWAENHEDIWREAASRYDPWA